VPEAVLLGLVSFGGTIAGILGMYHFSEGHKIGDDSQDFRFKFWLIIIFQLTILCPVILYTEELFSLVQESQ
jgi:uncharacterized membrane protein YsdA (DUF1294 family)